MNALRTSIAATLLLNLAWLSTASAADVGIGASFKGPIGLQLYSLREQFAKDVPGSLNKVSDMGFKNVELAGTYDRTPEEFKNELSKHGLKPISAHFPYDRFKGDLDNVVREAKELGVEYAGCAWITHSGPFDEKQCREAAAVFNKAGEALAKENIKFFYHTHGYEFVPFGSETLFDLLVKETDPENVKYEMDVFWVVHAGQKPEDVFGKHEGRFDLVHLKDMKKGTPTGLLTGGTDVKNDVVIGTGLIDYRRTLAAAQKAGVKWYFIEDESPTSEEQIPQSLKYLENVTW
jgi:sugar phosphate isomerase/epimerase